MNFVKLKFLIENLFKCLTNAGKNLHAHCRWNVANENIFPTFCFGPTWLLFFWTERERMVHSSTDAV